MNTEPQGHCMPPEVHNQGVFSKIILPINDDHIAVGIAIQDLLKEGWKHAGITKGKTTSLMPQECFYVELTREWKC